jgi:hypothetical protein
MERLGILSHDQQRHDCNLASQKATHPPRYLLKPHLNTDPQHRIAVLAEPSMPSPHRAAIWPSLTASAQGSPPPHYHPSVTNGKSQRGSPISTLHPAALRALSLQSRPSTCTYSTHSVSALALVVHLGDGHLLSRLGASGPRGSI